MTKLKPCPFCGGEVKIMDGALFTKMFVGENCGADVCFYGAEREPKAIEAWNRRVENENR